jgi:hypothetical protein
MSDLVHPEVREYEAQCWIDLEERQRERAERETHMIKLNYIQQAIDRISKRLDEIAAARNSL